MLEMVVIFRPNPQGGDPVGDFGGTNVFAGRDWKARVGADQRWRCSVVYAEWDAIIVRPIAQVRAACTAYISYQEYRADQLTLDELITLSRIERKRYGRLESRWERFPPEPREGLDIGAHFGLKRAILLYHDEAGFHQRLQQLVNSQR